jgi:hypothetical protein
MFFTFNQNNSGGRFRGPAYYVIIEADTPTEANNIAENHGVYFDGCRDGTDCECCGDRWYPVSAHDGHPEPMIYGMAVNIAAPSRTLEDGAEFCEVMIVYKDGRVVKAAEPRRTYDESGSMPTRVELFGNASDS